jgi:hypothetical protein
MRLALLLLLMSCKGTPTEAGRRALNVESEPPYHRYCFHGAGCLVLDGTLKPSPGEVHVPWESTCRLNSSGMHCLPAEPE